jgi:hypothetical protein
MMRRYCRIEAHLATEAAILDRPVFRTALPAAEVMTIEDRLEPFGRFG